MGDMHVGISLLKSVVSDNGSVELAKRFYWRGVDAFPLSEAEISIADSAWVYHVCPF